MMRSILPLAGACSLAAAGPAAAQSVATFDGLPFPADRNYENGRDLNPPGSFASGGAVFNNRYTASFDGFAGWAYSRVTNVTTPGFTNQYAAYDLSSGGAGDGSAAYGVAFNFAPGDATVTLPAGHRVDSMRVTNTTYAALSVLNGDPFAKKFGGPTGADPDFFLLTITGRNAQGQPTGAVEFPLADYRFADNTRDYVVSGWTTVDLSRLGADTAVLTFALTSSDVGQFGMNTPAYFAADNLSFTPVPEPAGVGLAAAAGALAWRRARRRT